MSSARIQRDIQALSRGELDVPTLIGRIRNLLVEPSTVPEDLLRELEEAHRDSAITTDDYERLTEFISAETHQTGSLASDATAAVGDTVFVESAGEPSSPEAPSETRLAPPPSDTSGGKTAEGDTIAPGTRLRDRFILDEVLGVGGMGTVYKGRDALKLEAQDRNPFVAVKILNESFKQRPEAFIALQREASRQQRLAHPNIATVYDFDRDGGVMFITMEFLDGHTLDTLIRDRARPENGLSFAEALPIIEDLCAALSHAHARGIVHADFKPGNCFLTSSNHVKVLDFGIARAMKDPNSAPGDETLFDPRSIGALTPAYASPEMLSDSAAPDPRDDIYALACVTYELLTGRHPFHRVPADQAKASELKPARVSGLSRRQNRALVRALEFDREDRTPSVSQFLTDLRQEPTFGPSAWRVGGMAAAGVALIALIALIPTYLDNRESAALVADLSSFDAGRINEALERLDDLGSAHRDQVLLESRDPLIDYFRTTFNASMSADDWNVPFADVGRLLASGLGLYPDSRALSELNDIFRQRRDAHLTELANLFEEYLTPERLLPNEDSRDLYDVLNRLREVDGGNTLLTDQRIQAAYAAATETELGAEDYEAARRYLDAGLALVADDPTLSDLRDRLEVIEQQQALAATIANVKAELEQARAAVGGLDDVPNLQPALDTLGELEPGAPEIAATGEALRSQLEDELDGIFRANSLAPIDEFLTPRYTAVWETLGQSAVPDAARARRAELVSRQDALEAQARTAISAPNMTADNTPVAELIAALRTIDPSDSRPDRLLEEVVTERQRRSQEALSERDWDTARAELNAALALTVPAALQNTLRADLERIGEEQAAYEAELARQQRLAEEQAEEQQRLAEEQAEEQRREAERQRQLEAAERERQLAAARQAEIDTAASAVAAAVTAFPGSDPVEAIRVIQSRMAALAALQPGHPQLAQAESAFPQLIERHVRGMTDTAAALSTLAALVELTRDDPALVSLRSELEQRRAGELEAERVARIDAASTALAAALADVDALQQTDVRRQADAALRDLENLAPEDTARLGRARAGYVAAFVAAAAPLIDAKRFSLAGELLQSAADQIPDDPAVASAMTDLNTARSAYREERAEQERLARLSALRQRLQLEVSTGELAQAERTLDELRGIDAETEFARNLAPALLAEAYTDRAVQARERGEFDAAREAISRARVHTQDRQALDAIALSIDRAELGRNLSAWFSGDSDRTLAQVAQDLERFKSLAGDSFATVRSQLEQASVNRLQALRTNPDAHNALLADLQSLLPDSRVLAGIQPLALRQTLALEDLLGRWCGDGMEVELTADSMRWEVGKNVTNVEVENYNVLDDLIAVRWKDTTTRNDVLYEFGRFSDARDQMTYLRARATNSDKWNDYNRRFRRCP